LGVEQARRVRAIAAMYDSVHSFMMYRCPSGSHDELLRPVDGQEREIHINITIIINYEVREGSEHLDVRKFSDLLSLENYTWDVHEFWHRLTLGLMALWFFVEKYLS